MLLYSMTCLRIFELSTHVTKSSSVRDTKNAGSFTTSVPTRTWPCSIRSVAFFINSDILSVKQNEKNDCRVSSPLGSFNSVEWNVCRCRYSLLTMTTGNRRRQKLLAEMLTALFKSHLVGINPSTYNFSKSSALISVRNGSFASISLIRFANSRMLRDNLLYLCGNCCKTKKNIQINEYY